MPNLKKVVDDIQTTIRNDCNAMVFPLRQDTRDALQKIVEDYGDGRYKDGYEEAIAVRLQDEF